MRPGLFTAGSLAGAMAAALLAGCAGSPMKTKAPDGLAFDCDNGGAATILFNDQGYLPDSSALARTRDGAQFQQPRSTATLVHAGASHALVAEWAELGLRYRATTPDADGRVLIVSLRGEEATIGWRPAGVTSATDADAAGERIAWCRRAGRATPPPTAHGSGDTHRP